MFSILRGGIFGKGGLSKNLTDSLKRAQGKGTQAFGNNIFGRAFNTAIADPAANSVISKLAGAAGAAAPLSPSSVADTKGGILGAALKDVQGKAKATPMADLLKIDKSKPKSSTKSKDSLTSLIKQLGQNPIGDRGGLPAIMGGMINI